MPPRIAPSGSRGRGGPPARGGGPTSREGSVSLGTVAPSAKSHISTVGVRRQSYGTSGTTIKILTNHFPVSIPKSIISHYDVVITPSEKTLPVRLNMDIIKRLQTQVAPGIFTPMAVYDGRKNLFAATILRFPNGEQNYEFEVNLDESQSAARATESKPKVFKVKLNKVAEINPVVLERFLEGKQSHDNDVLTAITALNVVVRMEPYQKYPFNVRSFFTSQEKRDIGAGIELWRGYFQSVRPAVGRMLINIDISTATMYKPGKLLDICLEFIGKKDKPHALTLSRESDRGFPARERYRLQRFISGIRVTTVYPDRSGKISKTPRVVKKIPSESAFNLQFTRRDGGTMRVSEYFENVLGRPLKYPNLPCVEVGSGAYIPIELCVVPEGQIMRKQVPAEHIKDILAFSTRKPSERLESIRNGLTVLSYGQSEYVRQFGMHMDNTGPLQVQARILPPPTLRYGPNGRVRTVIPSKGSWNMKDKQFYSPKKIDGWIVVVYERQDKFTHQKAHNMVRDLLDGFRRVGIRCDDSAPPITYCSSQSDVIGQLKEAGKVYRENRKALPTFIVAVLPEGGTDIYSRIKYFGDCVAGVATQCLKSNKCSNAKEQYFANVCLKINVKLGGINSVPDPASVRFLTDDANPTLVMGADVIHPAPGSEGRPSFTAVVGNVDSTAAYYVASSPRIQTSRQEMIEDLEDMAAHVIDMYRKYRKNQEKKPNHEPKRIIFYRDGVSEGQFQQVLDFEVPKLRAACDKLGIKPTPKLTVIVVGKRHHVRFFPMSPKDGDATGNCPAGTVVDRDVTSPAEFDFYLQSHGGLLGTSRPAHYNVLLDDNKIPPDGIQQLSYALCHVYARSTRSVSIPAPVYYADIVCSRAKNHFPSEFLESSSQSEEERALPLDEYKANWRGLHQNTALKMYFS